MLLELSGGYDGGAMVFPTCMYSLMIDNVGTHCIFQRQILVLPDPLKLYMFKNNYCPNKPYNDINYTQVDPKLHPANSETNENSQPSCSACHGNRRKYILHKNVMDDDIWQLC